MKVEFRKNDQIDKRAWDNFVQRSPQGHIFSLSWYLDTIWPDWSAMIVYDKENEITGTLPLTLKNKFLLTFWHQPLHAKYLGIMFSSGGAKSNYKEYSRKKMIAEKLIDAIPARPKHVQIYMAPEMDYPLPWMWKGYTLNAMFSYRIDLRRSREDIISGYSASLRNKIQAFDTGKYILDPAGSTDDLMTLYSLYERDNVFHVSQDYLNILKELIGVSAAKKMSKIIIAKDDQGICRAAILFFYFKKIIYYFIALLQPEHKHAALLPYMIHNEIMRHRGEYEVFDFQGSVIPGVEAFIRNFGAVPCIYYQVTKGKKFILI
jgi:hypothetical protein